MIVRMEIRIEVKGALPPAKAEAKSMLSATHRQIGRVHRLLTAASSEMRGRAPLVGGVGLDLTLTAPSGAPLPGATNMLGGVADVLQARQTGAEVEHLGPLGEVACFHDDVQIQEIRYHATGTSPAISLFADAPCDGG